MLAVSDKFAKMYAKNGHKPVSVEMRDIVKLKVGSQHTHLIHPYTAKLLPHIPHYFLSDQSLISTGGKILDPFSGSGTVLLEAALNGHSCYGADSNPLARLISRVKLTSLEYNDVERHLKRLMDSIPDIPISAMPPCSVKIEYWFYPHIINKLHRLYDAIQSLSSIDSKFINFFLVNFSACVRKVSLADPRLSVPVMLSYKKYNEGNILREHARKRIYQLRRINVFDLFETTCKRNAYRADNLKKVERFGELKSLSHDARALTNTGSRKLRKGSVDFVLTSPPYAGAQKYIRSSSLSLAWLRMLPSDNLTDLNKKSIGREDYKLHEYSCLLKSGVWQADQMLEKIFRKYPQRAHIAANYLVEMCQAFTESTRVLKTGGSFVLVAANNKICGFDFLTVEYLKMILQDLGLSLEYELVDAIKSRGLMTKRNKTASVIDNEHILMFKA